jgi:NADH-quinone oxidoreductase subunit N
MLIGLAVALADGDAPGPWNGVSALGFYLAAYAAATIGVFAVLEYLGQPGRRIDGVEELAGLGRTRPLAAALLALFMFSLTGVPPLAGFFGKLMVFGSALNVGGWCFTTLAIVGGLNAAVAAAYYLRVVAVMYFRTPLATPRAQGGAGAWWAAVVCAVLVVAIGVSPGVWMPENDCPGGPMGREQPTMQSQKKPPPQSAPQPGVTAHPNDTKNFSNRAMMVEACDARVSMRRKIAA